MKDEYLIDYPYLNHLQQEEVTKENKQKEEKTKKENNMEIKKENNMETKKEKTDITEIDYINAKLQETKILKRESRILKNIYEKMQRINCDNHYTIRQYHPDGKQYKYLKYSILPSVQLMFRGDINISDAKVTYHKTKGADITVSVTIRGIKKTLTRPIIDYYGNECSAYSSPNNTAQRYNHKTQQWETYILPQLTQTIIQQNTEQLILQILRHFGLGIYFTFAETHQQYKELLKQQQINILQEKIDILNKKIKKIKEN